jgi:hypothetical protein
MKETLSGFVLSFESSLALVRAIFSKQIILMVRYPINLLSGLLTMYVFFVMIFFGGQAVASAAINDNLEGLIIGFFFGQWPGALFLISLGRFHVKRSGARLSNCI